MKRRDFLKVAAPTAVLPFALGGFSIRAFGRSPIFEALTAQANCDDHVLVMIQLIGGNDGLNTVIPLDQYSAYNNARSNIAVAENQVLKLTSETGLHPQLTGLQQLYSGGKLTVMQSVGYPTPNFSHFRSTDIWQTASEYEEYLSTGWLGRFLEGEFPNFPTGYPNASMPHPLAIQVGSIISPSLDGTMANMGMAFTNPTTFYNINDYKVPAPVPKSRTGDYIEFLRSTGEQINNFATPVKNAATSASNKSTLWPAANQNVLADQLKIVSLLIAGGLKTKVYIVTLGGFDTHSTQNTAGSGTPFSHPQLMGLVSTAITAFQDDLKLNGTENRVVGMTFSEFGRRIASNSSGGTDHGAAAPLFVFGTNVKGGIIGKNPTIPANPTSEDNLPMLYDFRSVYASILKDWFCADDTKIRNTLFKDFQMLPIIKGSTASGVADPGLAKNIGIDGNYPNPFSSQTTVSIRTTGERVHLAIYDNIGREVRTLVDKTLPQGEYKIPFDASGLASGTYYARLETAGVTQTKAMLLAK